MADQSGTSGTRPTGFEIAVPTVFDHPAEPSQISFDLLVVGCAPCEHGFSLSLSEAAALGCWLVEAAAAREAAGNPDDEIEFTVPDEDEPGVYRVMPARARDIGAALAEAQRLLEAFPPQEMSRTVDSMDATTTDGATHRIEVYVTLIIPVAGDWRLKFACPSGTWTIDDDAPALANALEQAAVSAKAGTVLSVDPPPNESLREPWMTVGVRPDARVALRLYDDVVQETGKDGVLIFAPEEARRVASILRRALAFRDATPARLAVPPEPFKRVVATAAW